MNKYTDGINPPLNDYKEWPAISVFASEISAKYPRTAVGAQSLAPQTWADESYDLAVNFVYKDVVDPEKLPYKWIYQSYIDEGLKHAERRMAMAGYRLADTLVMLYQAKPPLKLSQRQKGVADLLKQ